jgi:hypothetical protein
VSRFTIGPNATRVGVASFSNGAFINFNLSTFSNVSAMITAIGNITYLDKGTQTSLGIQLVRDTMFTEANGMRPLSAGVPRVLIVVTDGQANSGFDPTADAASLRDTKNVNIFSVGVGCGYDLNQLNAMASLPVESHVYLLKSFKVIDVLIPLFNTAACDQSAILTPGQSTVTSVDACDIKYFRPQCGSLTSSIIIDVEDISGSTNVYISTTNANPGPFSFAQRGLSTTASKSFTSTQSGTIQPVYISVQGVSAANTFSLNVYSGLCFGPLLCPFMSTQIFLPTLAASLRAALLRTRQAAHWCQQRRRCRSRPGSTLFLSSSSCLATSLASLRSTPPLGV